MLVVLHFVFFLHSRNLLLCFQKYFLDICVIPVYYSFFILYVLCLKELNIVTASKKCNSSVY